jgi:outer membrane protein OmpA-like peptidoglycan-associated protein
MEKSWQKLQSTVSVFSIYTTMRKLYRMKRMVIFFLGMLSVIVSDLHCQEYSKEDQRLLEKANSFTASGDDQKAIRLYRNLLNDHENDTSLMLTLARSYSSISEHDKALFWLGEVVESPDIELNEHVIKHYVRELRLAGRYEIAKIWLEKIKLDLLTGNDTSGEKASVFLQDTAYINITSMNTNSRASDFCPVFYKSSLLFYSNRNRSDKQNINLAGDAAADLFSIPLDQNAQNAPVLLNELMGYGHYEGSFAFFDNYRKSILSKYVMAAKDLPKDNNKLSGLRLYSAQVDTGNNIIDYFEALPFNIHGYSVAHPYISEDGEMLLFASNIPGGYGGSDIYKSEFKDGSWSPPENLGPDVNSPYDEYFPYCYNEHTLFFTSNRPGGVGKFDLYKQQMRKSTTGVKPVNLGIPVNSEEDDFCLIVNRDGKSGYFTSNRLASKGKEDIFRFELKTVSIQEVIDEILSDDQFSHVKVKADRQNTIIVEPLGNTSSNMKHTADDENRPKINLESADHKKEQSSPEVELRIQNQHISAFDSFIPDKSNVDYQKIQVLIRNNGKIIYRSKLPEELNLSTFFEVKQQIKRNLGQIESQKDQSLTKKQNMVFRVQIAASKTSIPLNRLKEIYSGNRDIFEFREEGWIKYAIGDFNNYFVAAQIKENCGVQDAFIAAYSGEQKKSLMKSIEMVHHTPITALNINESDIVKKAEVIFEFNDIEIRDEVKTILDEISHLLKSDTSLSVTINGYTDFFGSELFNIALAKERADAVKSYFIFKDIQDERIQIYSKGAAHDRTTTPDYVTYDRQDEAPWRKAEIIVYKTK